MELLLYLGDHVDQTCTREDIMATVWSDTMPNEEALTQGISKLRKALGDTERSLLETVRKVGYRLNGPLNRVSLNRQVDREPSPQDAKSTKKGVMIPTRAGVFFTRRFVLSMAAMCLLALGISRVKVVKIQHEGVDAPRMAFIRMADDGQIVHARTLISQDDSTLSDVTKWIHIGESTSLPSSD